MIVIIEGPDGSGKSTLASVISKQTGYKVSHRVQPKTEEEKATMMEEYLHTIRSGKNMIFDRSWYSEMVYGPVMRGASAIDFSHMYDLERQLAKSGALIIYCTDSNATLWERCKERGEDYIVDRHTFDKICAGFDKLFAAPHYIPVVTYRCAAVHAL